MVFCFLLSSCSAQIHRRMDTEEVSGIKQNETYYNRIFCDQVGGRTEVSKSYKLGKVIVDCETRTNVYESGLDKRSSLDSLQQALFFQVLTGKKPVVVIYDTDGKIGIYEYQIQSACLKADVQYIRFPVSHFK